LTQLADVDRKAAQLTAIALATGYMPLPTTGECGMFYAGAGVARSGSETGFAVGLSTRITERLSVRVGVGSSGSTTAYGFGVGYALGGGSGAFEPCYTAKK
jgi:hypothetical protein